MSGRRVNPTGAEFEFDNGGGGSVDLASMPEAMRALAGHAQAQEGQRQVAKPISILDIYPDRSQPRRAIPDALRSMWNGQPSGIPALLDAWMRSQIPGRPADEIYGYFSSIISGKEMDRGDGTPNLFDALLDLAAEIHRDGLINPITAAPPSPSTVRGSGYQLETGERRWLAYHLLQLLTGEERWARIPVRVVERVDRFRQAAENSQRADLNMVARSRQWALLMMAAWEQQGRAFTPYEQCSNDRDYYAQAYELYPPDGMGTAIMNACGVTSRAMLSKYRGVLELSDEQWARADDENWSYGKIEGVLTAVNAPVKRAKEQPASPLADKVNHRVLNRVWRAVEQGAPVSREDIAHLRRWLDEVERG